jgi:hypothetical protein
VVESEHAVEYVDAGAEPEWARFIDDAYLSGEYAKTFGDLGRPVESTRFARHSIATARTQRHARRQAFSQPALAHAALARKDPETAVRAAHRAVDLSATVQSSRCIAAIRDLQSRISPYRAIASTRDFDHRAHEVLTQESLN